ncbi:MAG: pyruvate kinase, partial [Rhodocyclaceae bacterium]|nr:pyruvate kinase [Rhodocyclaceae bacterium]
VLSVAATVAYTSSGYSALRLARERPQAPIIGMTPRRTTARRLALAWGVHAVLCNDVASVTEMTELACETASKEGFGASGQTVVIAAGMPFGAPGNTNLLRIAQIA